MIASATTDANLAGDRPVEVPDADRDPVQATSEEAAMFKTGRRNGGGVSVDGDVVTGTVRVDWARDSLMAGVRVSLSEGTFDALALGSETGTDGAANNEAPEHGLQLRLNARW